MGNNVLSNLLPAKCIIIFPGNDKKFNVRKLIMSLLYWKTPQHRGEQGG